MLKRPLVHKRSSILLEVGMKFIKGLVCIGLLLSLTSCQSKVIQYTSEDASEYSLQKTKTSKAKMISVKTVNKNTIWTFQEEYDRGLQWQVFDEHVYDSTSSEESNHLSSNYTVMVLDYYLTTNLQIKEFFDIEYNYLDGFKSSITFNSEYDSRDTLKTKYEQFMTFMDYVKEQNAQYSDKSTDYEVIVTFVYKDHTLYTSDDLSFEELDQDNLAYAIEYNDSTLLKDYTSDEIKEWKEKNSSNRIAMKEEDQWGLTDFYAIEDHLSISSCVLYDLLSVDGHPDITFEGTRDSYTIQYKDKTYGPFEDEAISFIKVKNMTGIQFQIQENIDTLSE